MSYSKVSSYDSDMKSCLTLGPLTQLRHLKSGLMTDLLEGRVRVPEELQHP